MGHKVNPKIFRMVVNTMWDSKWYAKKQFAALLRQDILIRKYLKQRLKDASVSRIEIERSAEKMNIIVYAMKPGVIIGRSGVGIEEVKKELQQKILLKQKSKVDNKVNLNISIMEVEKPFLSSQIIVDLIIADLEKRIPFRRAMKQAIAKVEKAGAKGIKIVVAGRLNGSEIARTESLSSGSLPLHTIRADIDYSRGAAQTIYGKIGVKVWINRGEIFEKKEDSSAEKKPVLRNK